jgi:hypothetical protein
MSLQVSAYFFILLLPCGLVKKQWSKCELEVIREKVEWKSKKEVVIIDTGILESGPWAFSFPPPTQEYEIAVHLVYEMGECWCQQAR